MARSPIFQEFGQDLVKRNAGEIGMHLHAWNTPPIIPVTEDDFRFQPYLTEYSESIMRKKITVMTEILETNFSTKIVSHRAGRWALNTTYARVLAEEGYDIDCSVTPYISWKTTVGDPTRDGGPDYSDFSEEPYFVDFEDISRPGNSRLLEIPVTIISKKSAVLKYFNRVSRDVSPFARKILCRLFREVYWFRPNGKNLNKLLYIVKKTTQEKKDFVQFMLHSSELMPGGSPYFPRKKDIENLYEHLEILFNLASGFFKGATLKEYYGYKSQGQKVQVGQP
jgi:hypothetical protein